MKKGNYKTVESRVIDFNDSTACQAHIQALINKLKKTEKYLEWARERTNELCRERNEHWREYLRYKRMYEGVDMPSPLEVNLTSVTEKPITTKHIPLLQAETGKKVPRLRWRDRLFFFMDERNN